MDNTQDIKNKIQESLNKFLKENPNSPLHPQNAWYWEKIQKGIEYLKKYQPNNPLLKNESELKLYLLQHISNMQELANKIPVNPLSIIDGESINKQHSNIPDITENFKNDLTNNLNVLIERTAITWGDVINLLVYQTIDYLLEYHKHCFGYLPMSVVNNIKEQVKKTILKMNWNEHEQKYAISEYESLLNKKLYQPGIIGECNNYMKTLS